MELTAPHFSDQKFGTWYQRKPSKNDHQSNALAEFANFMLVISVLFEKRAT